MVVVEIEELPRKITWISCLREPCAQEKERGQDNEKLSHA
jgi:hypothetical protein